MFFLGLPPFYCACIYSSGKLELLATPSKWTFSKRILFKIMMKKINNHNLTEIYFCDDYDVAPLHNGP